MPKNGKNVLESACFLVCRQMPELVFCFSLLLFFGHIADHAKTRTGWIWQRFGPVQNQTRNPSGIAGNWCSRMRSASDRTRLPASGALALKIAEMESGIARLQYSRTAFLPVRPYIWHKLEIVFPRRKMTVPVFGDSQIQLVAKNRFFASARFLGTASWLAVSFLPSLSA